jgi:hypothetical protein
VTFAGDTVADNIVLTGDDAIRLDKANVWREEQRFKRGPWFSAKAFLASGDGQTDDRDAIQQAIDACADAGGGVVFIEPGTYLLGRALFLRDFVTLRGAGDASVLTRPASVAANITENVASGAKSFKVADASIFTVGRGIYLRDNTANEWRYPQDAYVTDIDLATNTVHISTPTNVALPTGNSPKAIQAYPLIRNVEGSRRVRVTELRLDQNRLDGTDPVRADQAFLLSCVSFVKTFNSSVDRCFIVNTVADLYSSQANNGRDVPGDGSNVLETRNHFVFNVGEDAGLYGVHLGTEVEGELVAFNDLDTSVDELVHFSSYCKRNRIAWNDLRNAGTHGIGSIDNRDINNELVGNVIVDAVNWGIDVPGGDDTIIALNQLRGCASGGVRIGGSGAGDGALRARVTNNVIDHSASGGNAVEVKTGSHSSLVAFNAISGGLTGAKHIVVNASYRCKVIYNDCSSGYWATQFIDADEIVIRGNSFDTFTVSNGILRFEATSTSDPIVEDNTYAQTTMTPITSSGISMTVRLVRNGMGDNGATDPDAGGDWNAIETGNSNQRHIGRLVRWNDGTARVSFWNGTAWTRLTAA